MGCECSNLSPSLYGTDFVDCTIPLVRDDCNERPAWPPNAFTGTTNVILKCRTATKEETARHRNMALNPYDVRDRVLFYPHATASSEFKVEGVFGARNVIDGVVTNNGHGAWPHQSWGPPEK